MASFLDTVNNLVNLNTNISIAENQRDAKWAAQDAARAAAIQKRADEWAFKEMDVNIAANEFGATQNMDMFKTMIPAIARIQSAEINASRPNASQNKPQSYGEFSKVEDMVSQIITDDTNIGWRYDDEGALEMGGHTNKYLERERPYEQARLSSKLRDLALEHIRAKGLEKDPIRAKAAVKNLLKQLGPVRRDPSASSGDYGFGGWIRDEADQIPPKERARFDYQGQMGQVIQKARAALFNETNAKKRAALKEKIYKQIMQSNLESYLKNFAWQTISRGS